MHRRSFLASATALAGAGLGAAGILSLTASAPRTFLARIPLYSACVAFTRAPNRLDDDLAPPAESVARTLWKPGDPPLVPGTRVREDAVGRAALTGATHTFLASSRLPLPTGVRTEGADGNGTTLADLETSALVDLHSLTWALPSPVAGWNGNWRYTWVRDTAHVIVALHERGHTAWALHLLDTLAAMQRPDGTFHARYVPGTAASPDSRAPQFDGVGLFAWSAAGVLTGYPDGIFSRPTVPAPSPSPRLKAALERACAALLQATAGKVALPEAGPDYWERPESQLTLWTAGVTLAGVRACEALVHAGVIEADAARVRARAEAVDAAIAQAFGPRGYTRYAGGGGMDAGVMTLLPPYHKAPAGGIGTVERAVAVLDEAYAAMARPAGGVAPAQIWKQDGVSWSPQTAMYAQAYATLGRHDRAESLLFWLAGHRTLAGAIPEKILADGSPAAVAPLAWTASLALRTLATYSRGNPGL